MHCCQSETNKSNNVFPDGSNQSHICFCGIGSDSAYFLLTKFIPCIILFTESGQCPEMPEKATENKIFHGFSIKQNRFLRCRQIDSTGRNWISETWECGEKRDPHDSAGRTQILSCRQWRLETKPGQEEQNRMPSYEFDIHTHTIASGHGSGATITDMAKAASEKGLRMIGISDHGPATLGGGKVSYFMNLASARRNRFGITFLYGAEANIMNQSGDLDLGDEVLSGLDFCIASMHRPPLKPGTKEENTKAYILAMENPYVKIIGHCDDEKFPVDPFALFQAAMKHHVLLEINNASLGPEGYRGDTRFTDLVILNLSKYYHYPVLFSSDSHGTKHVGDFTYAEQAAARAGVPDSLILNYSTKALADFWRKKEQAIQKN